MVPMASLFVSVLLTVSSIVSFGQQDKLPTSLKAPAYTMAEYNDYMNATQNQNPGQRTVALDRFVAQYPHSDLLPFAYQSYYLAYNDLKQYAQVVEYADKYLATAQAGDPVARLRALTARTTAFERSYTASDTSSTATLEKALDAATQAIALLPKIPKPQNLSAEQFEQEKKSTRAFYEYAAGYAELERKNYDKAVQHLEFASEVNERDPLTFLQLGISELKSNPPSTLDGFWSLARSIALNASSAAKTKTFLRDQIQRYQLVSCSTLVDQELEKLIELAGTNIKRPATYSLPSADDLQKIRENAGPILDDLRPGDEHSKSVWLAVCGLEFPEVGVRVLNVSDNDGAVTLGAFRAPTEKEMEAAKEPNMKINVSGQPEAARVKAGDWVRFQGTLAGYQMNPFMLTWDKATVNPQDIPAELAKRTTRRKQQTTHP
jgi:tetratricopeptide (TPR) repeat protein